MCVFLENVTSVLQQPFVVVVVPHCESTFHLGKCLTVDVYIDSFGFEYVAAMILASCYPNCFVTVTLRTILNATLFKVNTWPEKCI